jgi:hypothetical protein
VKVETATLVTVKKFATKNNVTTAYIYKLLAEQRMKAVEIDGVKFIDITKYPALPTK